jgi:hypothetical protein
MEVIGLLGHQGVGKNYIAEKVLAKVLEDQNTVVIALADHFKIDSICKHNLEYNKVFGQKDFQTRKKLQKLGTEEGRDKYGSDIWINILYTWMKLLYSRGTKTFIIPDLRFQNEVDWCKNIGGIVIKINASQRFNLRVEQESLNNPEKKKSILEHPSERGIDKIQNYDYEVNNDFEVDVESQIKKIFNL